MIKGSLSHLMPFTKLLLIFAVVTGSSMILTLLFALAAIPFTGLETFNSLLAGAPSLSYLKYLQVAQSFSVFIIPSLLVAWMLSDKPLTWLGFSRTNWILLVLSGLLFFLCQPMVSHLAKLNAQLTLPNFLQPLESWMHQSEETAGKLIFQFLDTRNPWDIAVNVFMVVLLPAIGEELLFRGSIQPTIGRCVKSQHMAIWITAFLFSAMHMQFLTFLPRFLLGGLLGYLFFYGKNILYPMVGHFVNNLLSLLVFYYYRIHYPDSNPMEADAGNYENWMVYASVVLMAGIILFLRKKSSIQKDPVQVV